MGLIEGIAIFGAIASKEIFPLVVKGYDVFFEEQTSKKFSRFNKYNISM